ncbi:MAG TPA: HNH endonuclease signature motif containing protein [Mycobacterium sp.]|nr:HNH endonuclease signature motif containing protein [Mycobacterium sp.]
MSSNAASDRETVVAAFDRLRAARQEVAALPFDALSTSELLGALTELEIDRRRQPATEHQIIHELTTRTTAAEVGGKNWSDVLQQRLHISPPEARRRLDEAADLGPRRAFTGEQLEPTLPNVAKRQAAGEIGAEHVRIIRKFLHDLPQAVDYQTRELCEETLATVAAEDSPAALRAAADRLAGLVNPDGDFSDVDRARRRYLSIGKQQADGMSEVHGLLDPEARATFDAVLAKLAAPGMCNPDDEAPCVDGEPSPEQAQSDTRSQPQRNHDALKAMGRSVLASGELGQHNGIPATIIVSTTLQELESGCGQAVTAGGSLLPMSDVIRLASHSHHYLAIFDKHTEEPLYLGRSKRLASPGQRIVLQAKDRGCTRPGCTAPGYWCQVHHVDGWTADDGTTDIDKLTLACGPDNRLVEKGGWTTRKRKDGRTEWIPPPNLDTGQARVNNYHHPQKYLLSEDDDP